MPKLRHLLRTTGRIYTLRKYRMDLATVSVMDVGPCRRTPIREVHDVAELEPYVAESGFTSVRSWWSMARHYIPNERDPIYLYKIETLASTQLILSV